MGAVASKYRILVKLLLLMVTISVSSVIFWGGLFSLNEAILIFASTMCAYLCISLHINRQSPEGLVITAAAILFLIAYILQAIIFKITSQSVNTTIGEIISSRSVFSLEALSAGPIEVQKSLALTLAGFVGILAAALYFRLAIKIKMGGGGKDQIALLRPRNVVSNTFTIGYIALTGAIIFGFFRKYLGLDSPVPSGLPKGIGGLINVISIYICPNLLYAAVFFALDHGPSAKVKHLIVLSLLLGLFNYILFTSKISLVFPVLYIVLCQYLLKRSVLSWRAIGLFCGLFVVVYPFLNFYRATIALGIPLSDLLDTVSSLYASTSEASEIDLNIFQIAIGSIIGRLVGYDPLLILLQAGTYPGTLLDYVLHGDLDKYLTYSILGFDEEKMGYSPGFLGRIFFISDSYVLTLSITALTVFLIAQLVGAFWRGDIRQRYIAPLLLTYCLIFFTDGIRFELVRALFLSSLFIYGFLRVVIKLRVTPH